MAEQIGPSAFTWLMNRYYETAADIHVDHDAIVDKFVGDEVIGIFIPSLANELHAARAIGAGKALLAATGHADPGGPWVRSARASTRERRSSARSARAPTPI